MSIQSRNLLKIGFAKESKVAEPLKQLAIQAGYSFIGSSERGYGYARGPKRERLWFEIARGQDLCRLLQRGVIDAALIGQDVVAEYQSQSGDRGFELVKAFTNVAPCRLVVAAPKALEDRFEARWWPQGLRYGTAYPALTSDYLAGMAADGCNVIVPMKGGVEASIRRGEADIIVDLVATGNTLRANDLVEVETLRSISAALVGYQRSQLSYPKNEALTSLGEALREEEFAL